MSKTNEDKLHNIKLRARHLQKVLPKAKRNSPRTLERYLNGEALQGAYPLWIAVYQKRKAGSGYRYELKEIKKT